MSGVISMADEHDAVIAGGGRNGLVAAAYVAPALMDARAARRAPRRLLTTLGR